MIPIELELSLEVDRVGLRIDEDAHRPEVAPAEHDAVVERILGRDHDRDHRLSVCLSCTLPQQAVSPDDA